MKCHVRVAAGTEWHDHQDQEGFSGGANVLPESVDYLMNGR
jgi:hypothetical protein